MEEASPARRSALLLAGMAAVAFLVLLLPSLSPWYGFYSDELYYLACTDRLAWGYVDHPPLFVFVLRLYRELFGDSLITLRALPAAAGGSTVFLTGWMARRMGGPLYAQALAALAAMMSGSTLASFSFFSVNCLAILLWTLASWVLLELCRSRDPRLWIALGALLGIAVLNKHTAAVIIAGVVVATLLSPLRRDLSTRWPWLGVLVFALIISPNLHWQIANDWPSLAFYQSVGESQNPTSPLEQVLIQVIYQNPASAVIWIAGIFYLLRSASASQLRPLAWLFLTAMMFAMIGGSRLPYRVAGAFPVLFAAGAVSLAGRRKPGAGHLRKVWNTYALPVSITTIGAAAATLALPVLPPEVLEKHPLYDAEQGTGWRKSVGRNRIPYHLGNRTHWVAFVRAVENAHAGIDPEQRRGAIILADYFGHAGALEYYWREHPRPPVYSPHTGYYLWGPPDEAPETVISIGIDDALLRDHFEHVVVADVFRCTFCPPTVNELPIEIATTATRPFTELWIELGNIGGRDRIRRMLRGQDEK